MSDAEDIKEAFSTGERSADNNSQWTGATGATSGTGAENSQWTSFTTDNDEGSDDGSTSECSGSLCSDTDHSLPRKSETITQSLNVASESFPLSHFGTEVVHGDGVKVAVIPGKFTPSIVGVATETSSTENEDQLETKPPGEAQPGVPTVLQVSTTHSTALGSEEDLERGAGMYSQESGSKNRKLNRYSFVAFSGLGLSRLSCCACHAFHSFREAQILAGVGVAVGQIPEIIAYALIAGVDPLLALQSTWIMNVISGIIGGRPGVISGPTGAVSVALINLVRDNGTEYVFYTILFSGLLQVVFGVLRLSALLRLVPRPTMVGYVNSMSFILTIAQLKYFKEPYDYLSSGRSFQVGSHRNYYQNLMGDSLWVDRTTLTAMLLEAGLAFCICLAASLLRKQIPAAFIAIASVTIIEWVLVRMIGFETMLIRDLAPVQSTLVKSPFLNDNYNLPPVNLDTFHKIWPASIAVFGVSTIESLLTFRYVGDKTKGAGSSDLFMVGQGIANVVSPLLGGMGGGAMLGQSVINSKFGGVGKISSVCAGILLFFITSFAYPAVDYVPLSAIAGIMFYAAFSIMEFRSFLTVLAAFFPQQLRDLMYVDCKVNRCDTFIMVITMAMTFFLDPAIATIVGSAIAAYAYCWDWSNRLEVDRDDTMIDGSVTYRIKGPLFFATSHLLLDNFPNEFVDLDPEEIVVLMEEAEVFDWSGMVALKQFHDLFASHGKSVALSTISMSTKRLMEKSSAMWEGVVFLELREMEDMDEDGAGESAIGGDVVGTVEEIFDETKTSSFEMPKIDQAVSEL